MRRPEQPLPLGQAVILGLVQGPAELLPVSSSAHTALIPWLAGWPYAELDGDLRKSFEVALHMGGVCALALGGRRELLGQLGGLDRRRASVLALALAPPAIAGYALRRAIESRLGGPRAIATGLVAGAVAMALADAGRGSRRCEDAGPGDGLALGLAQAIALVPGVSRNGATLTAARARGFDRRGAHRLSWAVAAPVILGAGALQGRRLRDPGARRHLPAFAAGAMAAFLSTLASARLLRRRGHERRALLPYSLYRCLLAALALRRLRRAQQGL
jgi:undecaprenyl-diphosphatase